jgi:Lar family restriction alleviation protein
VSEELKPCPFCGCNAVLHKTGDTGDGYFVKCWGCDAETEGMLYGCDNDAIKQWNTRPIEDQLRAELDQHVMRLANAVGREVDLRAEVERLTAENHELHGVLAEVNRLRSEVANVYPWAHYPRRVDMTCRFCGYTPQYGSLLDPENEKEWHNPDCIWLQAKLAEGGEG